MAVHSLIYVGGFPVYSGGSSWLAGYIYTIFQ